MSKKSDEKKEGMWFRGAIRRNIWLWGFVLIGASILFYWLYREYKCTHLLLSDIFKLIAGSSLTAGLFSVLLGFTDFIDYVTYRLRDIIVHKEYLNTLSEPEQVKLKGDIDEAVYGKDAIKDPNSLYTFLKDKLTVLFRSGFRSKFNEEYIYRSSNTKEDYWVVENHTIYRYHRNKEPKFSLFFGYQTDLLEKMEEDFEFLRKMVIKIDDETFHFKKKNGKHYLIADNENEYMKNDLEMYYSVSLEKKLLDLNFELEVADNLFREKDSVLVNITTEYLSHKTDNHLTFRMTKPTQDLSISFTFLDGKYQMSCSGFGFNPAQHVRTEKENFAKVVITEWIMPGHGAVISWVPKEENQDNSEGTDTR